MDNALSLGYPPELGPGHGVVGAGRRTAGTEAAAAAVRSSKVLILSLEENEFCSHSSILRYSQICLSKVMINCFIGCL